MKKMSGIMAVVLLSVAGCMKPQEKLATLQRPERSAEMDALETFVGAWDVEAEMLGVEGADRMWKGMAEWRYTLDGRALAGNMSLRNPKAPFQTQGLWSYNPAKKTYVWSIFNDWGYPQQGKAKYKVDKQTWVMDYVGSGLDGFDNVTGRDPLPGCRIADLIK